jgi:hypothetical protein
MVGKDVLFETVYLTWRAPIYDTVHIPYLLLDTDGERQSFGHLNFDGFLAGAVTGPTEKKM